MDTVLAALAATSVAPTASDSAISKKHLDASLKDQAASVKQVISTQREVIISNIGPILTKLDPATDTVSLLAIFQVALEPSATLTVDRRFILDRTLEFLLDFNPYHIRYAGAQFQALLEYILSGRAFTAKVSVEAVASALLRVDPSGSMFTSIHLPLARFAYEKGYVEPALKVLDRDILFYPGMSGQKDARYLCDETLSSPSYISPDTGLTDSVKSTTVLEYNLLSGLCYTARKDWIKAQKAFERVITHPTRDKGLSQIMVDAYKRWLLVSLLKDGGESELPQYTSPSAKNSYITLAAPYKNIATLFHTSDVSQLRGEIEANRKVWEEDENTSLIGEVVAAYQKWQIINAHKIYQQVSISQLRKLTFSAESGESLKTNQEVIDLVGGMIASNMLKAELQVGNSGEDGYLTFQDETMALTEAAFATKVAACSQNIQSLGKQYQATNERLSSNSLYIRHLLREQKRAEKDGADAGIGFDAQIEDEDLMTGIIANS